MFLKLFVLFFTPLISGLLIFLVPSGKNTNFKLLLVFAGSYLFGITVTHILPELYQHGGDLRWIGVFVLLGFFLQQVLEYFSSGIEHGHMHTHDHQHHGISASVLLLALCVHAFLEGGMLAQPLHDHTHSGDAILLGIALHRAPAAFALMTVLVFQLGSKVRAIPHLFIFSVSAPIGLLLSTYLSETGILSAQAMHYLYALVCGNFLHISTTIVFETSPHHTFNIKKMLVAVIGAILAIVVEFAM
jgi:zinc transporter ZupT